MLGNKRIPLPACVYVEIKKESPVEKHESYAGFDLRGICRRLARVCLIFTLFIFTNCNTNCSTNAKYWKNMALKKKTFQSYSFGDQQLTEPLLHRHIHRLIYFNNTFNYGNGLSYAVISRGCSSHQFTLQKEHKSRMDTRLSSLSHQYERPHMYT